MTGLLRPRAVRQRFDAEPAVVGRARQTVRRALAGWEVRDGRGLAVLLTSEVMTNAVRHGGGPVELVVSLDERGTLEVAVHDTHPEDPVVSRPRRDSEAGRGMMLVSSLADRWGVRRPSDRPGKVVWFELQVHPGPEPSTEPLPLHPST